MVKASKGSMARRTRMLRGKRRVSVAMQIKTYNVGDRVVITPKARREGMPNLRFNGRHGQILEKRGKSYVVDVKDLGSRKTIIAGPVHLTMEVAQSKNETKK